MKIIEVLVRILIGALLVGSVIFAGWLLVQMLHNGNSRYLLIPAALFVLYYIGKGYQWARKRLRSTPYDWWE